MDGSMDAGDGVMVDYEMSIILQWYEVCYCRSSETHFQTTGSRDTTVTQMLKVEKQNFVQFDPL